MSFDKPFSAAQSSSRPNDFRSAATGTPAGGRLRHEALERLPPAAGVEAKGNAATINGGLSSRLSPSGPLGLGIGATVPVPSPRPARGPTTSSTASITPNPGVAAGIGMTLSAQPRPRDGPARRATAVVYCEANFGAVDGKTANGLVRHSETYDILSIIDSRKAGLDSGEVLGDERNGIPVCRDLAAALKHARELPDWFIFGMAPASGMLSTRERGLVLEAMDLGMNIVNGLHEFLNDDPEFVAASTANNVQILDIRRPPAKKDLRLFSGAIDGVTCRRIAVLGTDGAIGKRTTATILTRILNERGLKTVMVGTGQTGLMQGARYGIALDAIPSQFCSGEMEGAVVEAFEGEDPDVIIIEGQGALSHPAYLTSTFILRGSRPDGVVLQHAPGRTNLGDFDQVTMPTPTSEINLIQTFADTKVIGLTINHEHMTDAEVDLAIAKYERELGIPVTDALTRSTERLVDMVVSAFPELKEKLTVGVQ